MVYLAEQLAETVTRAHHAHFQRRYARARHPRHFVIPHVVHVLHQERLALLPPQLPQGVRDFLPPRGAIRRMLLRRAHESHVVAHESLPADNATRASRSATLDYDAEQPCAKPL